MFFFIGSLLLHIYYDWIHKRVPEEKDMHKVLVSHVRRGINQQCSLIFKHTGSVLSDGSSRSSYWRNKDISANIEKTLMEKNGRQLLQSVPQIMIELREWTSHLNTQNYPVIHHTVPEGKCFVVVTALTSDDKTEVQTKDIHLVTEYLKPIAWRSGDMFGIIGECSEKGLGMMATAFLEGRLSLGEEPLQLAEICTVGLEGHAQNLIRTDSSPNGETFSFNNDLGSSLQKNYFVEGNSEVLQEEDNSVLRYDGYDADDDELGDDYSQGLEIIDDEYDEGAGEAMFSMGESSLKGDDGDGNSSVSGDSSPSKIGFGFGEGGAGEALSPSIEDRTLLAPFRRSTSKSKPPNILIYCGKKDSQRFYEGLKSVFSLCLNSEKYAIYHLKHEQVLSVPWVENTAGLIISCDRLYDNIENRFLEYFHEGGAVCAFSSTFDSLFTDKEKQENYSGVLSLLYSSQKDPVMTICGMSHYTRELRSKLSGVELRSVGVDSEGRDVILEAVHESSGGMAILSQCNLDKDPSEMAITSDIYSMLKQANPQRFAILRDLMGSLCLDNTPGPPPALTPCVLLSVTENSKGLFYNSLKTRLKDGTLLSNNMKLQFLQSSKDIAENVISESLIPVIVESLSSSFKMDEYRKHLKTKVLGNTVLYGEVVTSTMPLIDAMTYSVPEGVGLIAIARSQTLGKGRSGNTWISPVGCAMFSLQMKFSLSSKLGQRVSYIQHITSLAVAQAVTTLPGYQNFPLKLKWPNDIYYENKIKLGGVIVKSSVMGDAIHINIGCGVNLNNQNPTSCLNELIQVYNQSHDTKLPKFTSEQLIARTVTQIEEIVEVFQHKGADAFLEMYYKQWLHSDQTVEIHGLTGEANILGLDDYGYLKVQLTDGSCTSVHPDGNSFDIMKNLIIPKT